MAERRWWLAVGTVVLAMTFALLAAPSVASTDTTAGDRAPADAASTAQVARLAPVRISLRLARRVGSGSSLTATVRLSGRHRLPAGRVALAVDGRRVAGARLAGGRRTDRVRLVVPGLGAGSHRARAVFRVGGRTLGHSRARSVTAAASCAAAPSSCGFPDASTTGPRGAALTLYDHSIEITRDGAVLENAEVHGSVVIAADDVTVRNVKIVNSGEDWGIGISHGQNATIDHCEISAGTTRLLVGIKDIYGDAQGTRIRACDISGTSTGVQIGAGVIEKSYIHDLGYEDGDHLNGTTSNGSTTPLTIRHNTIFNQADQTDAVSLFQDFGVEANRTITDNLLAGGGYTIYGGDGSEGATSNIVITDNRISRIYHPDGGYYGPVAAFTDSAPGNVWSGNVWDDTGAPVRS